MSRLQHRTALSVCHLSASCFILWLILSGAAAAATISFAGTSSDGHPVSATAEFTPNPGADTLAVKLTNTTLLTLDAGELFTGIDFSLGGLTPALASDTGIQRTVAADGSFGDTGTALNLTWSVNPLGGPNWELNFTPDAKDGLIGPPTAGTYAAANGSIKDNGGHNPFAAQVAGFVLSVPGLEANTPLSVTAFRFGTTLDPGIGIITFNTPVPEPSSLALAFAGLSILALSRRQ
jgi:hypothetical protein